MFAGLTGFHFLIIAGVLVLIFGASKLPVFAKSLGQSAKILRHEIKTIDGEPAPVAVPAATGSHAAEAHTAEAHTAERADH